MISGKVNPPDYLKRVWDAGGFDPKIIGVADGPYPSDENTATEPPPPHGKKTGRRSPK